MISRLVGNFPRRCLQILPHQNAALTTLAALQPGSSAFPTSQSSSTLLQRTRIVGNGSSSTKNRPIPVLPPNRNHQCQLRVCLSTVAQQQIPIPPNLHIDPRSSFLVHKNPRPSLSATPRPAGDSSSDDGVELIEDDNEEFDDLAVDTAYLQREVRYAVPLPDRLRATVWALDGTEAGSLWLDARVFGRDPIRIDLLKRAVDYIRAKIRGRRSAVTKTIAEVSGSGRKLRPQKGLGKARVGHRRPPHFRGGAKAHGPKNVTDYGNTKLNKKVRKQALCHALSQKLKEGNLMLVNSLEIESHKTRVLDDVLRQWTIGGTDGASALVLDHYYPAADSALKMYRGVPANLFAAARNIPRVRVGNTHAANVYDLLKHDKVVLTLEALKVLEGRLKDY